MRGAAHRRISYENTGCDSVKGLHIEGMPKVEKLNALVGGYINLEYRLPNGQTVKFLDDNATYLGNQLECEFGGDRSLISIAINKKQPSGLLYPDGFKYLRIVISFSYAKFRRMQLICKQAAKCRKSIRSYRVH